jgi:hypothetical protein
MNGTPLATRSGMAHRDVSGLTACYDFVSMLEAELRTAKHLRNLLEANHAPAAAPELKHLCDRLVENAVETARTAAHLRDQVCHLPRELAVTQPLRCVTGSATHRCDNN